MDLTIHRGTQEIGGSCVELSTSSTRLVVDVGIPLVDANREPFDQTRLRGKAVEQLLAEGILPDVSGLFDASPRPDAILLSHAHADHSGLLQFTRSEIPVHLSQGTSKMLMAGSIFAGQPGFDRSREHVFEPEKPFAVGDFTVTAYRVDHSAFDSMAFIIEADGKRVLYSGDLRLHGRKPWMAKRLVAATKGSPIDVMLMEGTNLGSDRPSGKDEHALEEEIAELATKAPGLVLAAFSPMHVDRLVTVYKAARRSGRTFVVDVYAAFVMHLVSSQCRIPRPTAEAGMRVLMNQSFMASYEQRRLRKIHDLFKDNKITIEQIVSEPTGHLMVFRPSIIERDFGGALPHAATCIYSYWPGYLSNDDWQMATGALEAAGGQLRQAHTSGHIHADDIAQFVEAVGPAMVIPIHTMVPDDFLNRMEGVTLARDGIPISLV